MAFPSRDCPVRENNSLSAVFKVTISLQEWKMSAGKLRGGKKKKKRKPGQMEPELLYSACLKVSSGRVAGADSSCCCLFVCCVSDSFFSPAGQLNCLTSRRPLSLTHKPTRIQRSKDVIGSLCAHSNPLHAVYSPFQRLAFQWTSGQPAAGTLVCVWYERPSNHSPFLHWPNPYCETGYHRGHVVKAGILLLSVTSRLLKSQP